MSIEYVLEVRASIFVNGLPIKAGKLPPTLYCVADTEVHPNVGKMSFVCPECGAAHHEIVPTGVEHNLLRFRCRCKPKNRTGREEEEG